MTRKSNCTQHIKGKRPFVSRWGRFGILGWLLLLFQFQATAQNKTITGHVYDEQGQSLPGATILAKGTEIGTIAGMDGDFSIEVPSGTQTLVASFIGMEDLALAVDGKTYLKFVLKPQSQTIDEVVVTGYQKVNRKLFTGAASRVKMSDVELAGETDISKSLEGQVSGVTVQNVSSTFGTAPKIKVRGSSSIYGVQKPLWVIDGIVLEDAVEVSMDDLMMGDVNTLVSSGVAGLNMDDVESFQVLKDGSATAIYGARAMNGVIVITTKSGKKGKVKVNYSTNITTRLVPSYSDYNILNSVDQMSINRELYEKGWVNVANLQNASTHGPYGKMFEKIANNELNWLGTNSELQSFLMPYETANTDWFKELFKTDAQMQHTLSISGGSDKTSFYASLGYLNDAGWTIADKVDRYTALLKGTFKLSDKFTVTAQSNLSVRDQVLASVPQSYDDVGGVDRYTGRIDRQFDNNPFMYAMTTSRNIRAYDEKGDLEFFRRNYVDFNIIDEINKNQTGLDVKDMSFNTSFEYKIKKNLSLSARVSARHVTAETRRTVNENSNEANAYRAGTRDTDSELIRDANDLLYERPGTTTGIKYSILPEGGILETNNDKMENYFANANINWNPLIGEDHMFTFLLGTEVRYINRTNTWAKGYGHFYEMGNVSKPSTNYLEYLEMEGESYFGTGNTYERFLATFVNYGYSYKGKYTLNGTFRYEGSNRLGRSRDARWMPAWNISGKWAVGEEDALQQFGFLDQLNLRVGYSLTAMSPSKGSADMLAISSASSRPFHPDASELGVYIESVENNDLTWEKTYEFNVGADAAFLNNRLSLELDFYKRSGFDLTSYYLSNGISGTKDKWGNVADMDSYGYELMLSAVPIRAKGFSWRTTINYSYHRNTIKNLKTSNWVAEAASIRGIPIDGGPVRGIYSARFAGLDNEGVPTFYDRNGEVQHYLQVQTSDFSDFTYSGSIDPTTTLGFTNSFSFKGITLSTLISGQFGHKKRVMQSFSYLYTDAFALNSNLVNRWRVEGDEAITNIPAILDATLQTQDNWQDKVRAYQLYGMSDYWIADASFVRLKNVSINYSLPKSWIKSWKLSNVSVGVQATNLALLWLADPEKLSGEDPEFVWSGGTSLPITKQFTFSFKAGF